MTPIDYTNFAHPKKRGKEAPAETPPPRARRALPRGRRNAEEHNAVVARVRKEVFVLDPVCVVCGGRPQTTDAMHETTSRAKTRGRPPDERFNRRVCVRVHRACHEDVTEHRIELAYLDPALGVDGGLVIQKRGTDEAVVYRRGAQPPHARLGTGHVQRGIWTPRVIVGGVGAGGDGADRPVDQPVPSADPARGVVGSHRRGHARVRPVGRR